jgi:DNA-binding LytR/AlgR family response regulator
MKDQLFLRVSNGKRKLNLPLLIITHIVARKEYVDVFTFGGKCYCKCMNIGMVEKLLKYSLFFFKSHKSHILNTNFLEGSERNEKGLFAVIQKELIPVSRRNEPSFHKLIDKITVG